MSVPARSPQAVSVILAAGLHGSVQLLADELPVGALPPTWQRSGLRTRMLLWRTLTLFAFCAVVLGSAYGIGTMISVAVTSVYPDNPGEHLTVVGHDSQSWTPWPFAVGAIMGSIAAGLFLARSVRVYRRARSLATDDVPWRQLTSTVKRLETTRQGTRLWLEAPDLAGQPQTFCLYPMGLFLSADARPGSTVTFWLKTDGGHEALLTGDRFPRLRFVTLAIPADPRIA